MRSALRVLSTRKVTDSSYYEAGVLCTRATFGVRFAMLLSGMSMIKLCSDAETSLTVRPGRTVQTQPQTTEPGTAAA